MKWVLISLKIFEIPKIVDEKIIGKQDKIINIDETDLKILKILSNQANLPIIEIARKTNISAKQVAYRIKDLEKKEAIIGYNAILDESKMDFVMFKVDFYLLNHSRLSEMTEFVKQHKNVKNIMKTVGGPDFEIEVIVKDTDELQALIGEIRERFSDVLDYYRYNRFIKTIKQVYLPIDNIQP